MQNNKKMLEFGSGLQPNLACQGKLVRLFALGRVCVKDPHCINHNWFPYAFG